MNILNSSAHSAPNQPCFGVIVAARSGSSRLPGKALLPLDGVPMIVFLLRRIRPSIQADAIIFATTDLTEDDELASIVAKEGFEVYRGANQDVVARYVNAAQDYALDYVVRITGDCPFVDSASLDYCIARCKEFDGFDLASTKGHFPVGIDYEIFRADMLASLHESDKLTSEEREHLTLHFYNNNDSFNIRKIQPPEKWKSETTFTVDTRDDYLFACALAERLSQTHGPASTITSAQGIVHSGMVTEYSKPLGDIAIENKDWLERDDEILQYQNILIANQKQIGKRGKCLLCRMPISTEESFKSRSLTYLCCDNCGHIQSEYLIEENNNEEFSKIYPPIDNDSWQSRCYRIYMPKLKWIIKHLNRNGISRHEALNSPWFEIGAGAGFFLCALKAFGASQFKGLEASHELVLRANQIIGWDAVKCSTDIEIELSKSNAKIFVSFFVLEHLADPNILIRSLADKPTGTIFVFSVPTYGMSTILESAFSNHAARNLDGAIHRQLFTDKSISYLLNKMNYQAISQWIFGQDALDFKRLILKQVKSNYTNKLYNKISIKIENLTEVLQESIDKIHFSDARHVIAIKK